MGHGDLSALGRVMHDHDRLPRSTRKKTLRRASRRVGLRARAHARGLPAGDRDGRRLRRAGSRRHQGRRADLPARRQPRAHHQRRGAVSRSRVEHQTIEGKTRQAWLANDFTLAEIKTLDAGSWFDTKFAGERVPTFDEAVALIRGKAGLFPELKTPEIYAGRDVEVRGAGRGRARQARAARAEGRSEDAGDPADVRPAERAQAGADQDRRAGGAAARATTRASRPRRS